MRRRPGRSVSCGTGRRSAPSIWWSGCGPGTACCWSRATTSGCRTTFASASARSWVTFRRRSPRRNEASSARSPTEMQVVPLEAFRDKIPFSVAIAAVERGFAALGRGEAELPDPMVLELRAQQAEVHVKGAHLAGGRHIALKVATGFYRNRARGLPSGDGMFLLLDADTGVPAVLLEEHGYLTDFRTAAAVAVTLKYLAPKDARQALLARADKLVADRVFQTERYGNLHHAVVAGAMTRDKVYAELGALAAGRLPGRESASEITVADLTGVGVQDAAIAQAVVEALGL